MPDYIRQTTDRKNQDIKYDAHHETWYIQVQQGYYDHAKVSLVGKKYGLDDIFIRCYDKMFRKFATNQDYSTGRAGVDLQDPENLLYEKIKPTL